MRIRARSSAIRRAVVVDIVAAFAQTLLRAFLRSRCAFEVDFLRTFRGFRQNPHLIGKHFGKTPGHGKRGPGVAFSIAQLTDFQLRKQGRMTRKNTKISVGARNLKFVHLLVNERAFRSDDRTAWIMTFIFSACSSTSSMVPTM